MRDPRIDLERIVICAEKVIEYTGALTFDEFIIDGVYRQRSSRGVPRSMRSGDGNVTVSMMDSDRHYSNEGCRDSHTLLLASHILDQKSPGLSPGGAIRRRPGRQSGEQAFVVSRAASATGTSSPEDTRRSAARS